MLISESIAAATKGGEIVVTKIKILRTMTGTMQNTFARKIGLAQPAFSKIESGQMSVPPKWRLPIALALNTTINEIIESNGRPILVK